jgi:hypothetical protein
LSSLGEASITLGGEGLDSPAGLRAVRFRRVERRISNLLAAASLVLCAATVALWIRSYRGRDALPRRVSASAWQVQSTSGRVIIVRFRVIASPRSPYADIFARPVTIFSQYAEGLLNPPAITNGFGFGRGGTHGSETHNGKTVQGYWINAIAVPYWFLALLVAAPSAPAVRSILARRRAAYRLKNQRCVACNYDLRASKERCPECGAAIPAAGTQALRQ